jgi:tetratricopeptide (TPR) repeat protein
MDSAVGVGGVGARAPARSRRRLWLLRAATASLPFALLALVELALRVVPGLGEDRDPFVNVSPLSAFSRQTIDGTEYFTITHDRIYAHGSVRIAVEKPANTVRIFCVGSSACAGWPHPRGETFSAYLEQALAAAYPDRKVEVVNAAAHGFAAYRTRRVLDEVLQMQPDAVLVWEGNNEFLEDRNYDSAGAWVDSVARCFLTVQRLCDLTRATPQLSGEALKGEAQTMWKKSRQQALHLREDPVQFAKVQDHFRWSIEHMVDAAQRRRVPIVLCTVPVNLRDWVPTASCNRLVGAPRERWQELYDHARRCLLQQDYEHGIEFMRQAIAMEGEHAESYFWLGRLLEADQQKAAAWDAYSKARDQDYNPFRALGCFNETIRALARDHPGQGVHLLDLDRVFTDATANAAPGFDLFLDYVHPTKPANLVVAAKVYDLLIGAGVLPGTPTTKGFTFHDNTVWPTGKPYRDETDPQLQNAVLVMLQMNHQCERTVEQAASIMELENGHRPTGPDDPALARMPAPIAESYVVFSNYLDVERRVILGEPVDPARRQEATRRLNDFYDRYYSYGKE